MICSVLIRIGSTDTKQNEGENKIDRPPNYEQRKKNL